MNYMNWGAKGRSPHLGTMLGISCFSPSDTKYLKFSKLEPSSSKEASGFKELKNELQGFDQELKRLKGK